MEKNYRSDKISFNCVVVRLNKSDGPLSGLEVSIIYGTKNVTVMVWNEKTGRDYESWCKHGTKVNLEGYNVVENGMKFFEVDSIKKLG